MRTYVAVDGGMSDNLRPMLYGSRYEALIADRAADAPDTLATVAGMHCESGDILVRDAMLAAPARRRRPGHPGDRRLRSRDGEQLQRRAAAAGDLLLATATRGSWSAARPTTTCSPRRDELSDRSESGCSAAGTVGGAFADLLGERADAVEAATGRRPEIAGVLRRSRGRLRARSSRRSRHRRRADRRHRPRRATTCCGRCAPGKPRGHRQQAAARPARRRALRRRPRGRRPAALRGRGRRRDPDHPGDPGEPRRDRDRARSSGSSTGRPTSSSPRWRRPAPPTRTCWPARRSSATPRPTRPRTSTAPTPRRRWRSSPGSPSTRRSASTTSPSRGSRRSSPTTSPTPRSSGSR